jgi:predicted nuclease of predicted toxin-antitoxin system
MKFFIDAQLPPALCRWFIDRGHEAVHVIDAAAPDALDVEIANLVEMGGYALVTKDEDFAALRLPDRFALLWLRCGNISNAGLQFWLDNRWPEIERLLMEGEHFIEIY